MCDVLNDGQAVVMDCGGGCAAVCANFNIAEQGSECFRQRGRGTYRDLLG
jgi:hypothetical protein